jgi:protein kinase A
VYQLICSGKYDKEKAHFSANLMDIIEQLLQKNPSKRIGNAKGGVADICKHKWFGAFDWKGLLRGTLAPVFVPHYDATNPIQPKIEDDMDQPMVRMLTG